MKSVLYKNLIVLVSVLIFILCFWTYREIQVSQALIESAQDAVQTSIKGHEDALADYQAGYYSFQEFEGEYLGLSEEEIQSEYLEYLGFRWAYCIPHAKRALALFPKEYSYTTDYVIAYNSRLKRLLNHGKSNL